MRVVWTAAYNPGMIDTADDEPSEPRFQFGLRSLLVIQFLVCTALGLWTWHAAPFVLLAAFALGCGLTTLSRAIVARNFFVWLLKIALMPLGIATIMAAPLVAAYYLPPPEVESGEAAVAVGMMAAFYIVFACPPFFLVSLYLATRIDDGTAELIALVPSLLLMLLWLGG
jgi:hypothetical protein